MTAQALVKTVVETAGGPVWLWSPPGALSVSRPALLVLNDLLAPRESLAGLAGVLAVDADVVVAHLPGPNAPALAPPTPAGLAAALDEAVGKVLADRPLVLLGVGAGALVALAMRPAGLKRIVAVDPPFAPARLWSLIPHLRARLEEPAAAPARDVAADLLGLTGTMVAEHNHLPLAAEAPVRVHVIVGDVPLNPPRRLDAHPSFVDQPERRVLAALPNVVTHLAPGAGHAIADQAPATLTSVAQDVLRAAAGARVLSPAGRALLALTPVTARRVGYVGPEADAFLAEAQLRNPAASGAPPYDVLAVADALGVTADDVSRLAAEGVLVAGVAPHQAAAARTRFAGLGLETTQTLAVNPHREYFDDPVEDLAQSPLAEPPFGVTVVMRTRRPTPEPRLEVRSIAFAPAMMDIRARLPSHAMRTEADISAAYLRAPADPPAGPRDRPKVAILQRPALPDMARWKTAARLMVERGWVTVMEFDDHPELIAAYHNQPMTEAAWGKFGCVHAVQTSTESLARAFRDWNPEVRVFRNAVFDLPAFPESLPQRVFYGAVARGEFAVAAARGLAPAIREFPETEFVVVGDQAVFEALPTARKTYHAFVPYERYLHLMAGCAISLSPIEALPLRDTKSDAKFLDAASRGVLTIASPTIYAETIRHRDTGLIAERAEDFGPLLAEALRDVPFQRRMARNAWDYVRTERMFADQARARLDWYRDLWRRRDALDAALIARVDSLRL